MTSIYDLSWGETSFLAKLQLFFKSRKQEKGKIRSGDRQVQVGGYSALSSTYYSIVGTAFSQLKAALRPKWLAPVKFAAWCITWLPLATWCYWRMLPLSNRIVELIGYDGMSADQCDVRQSVLRRRSQYNEAKKCIRAALAKNPEKAHTRGLLRVGLAEIYRTKVIGRALGKKQMGQSRKPKKRRSKTRGKQRVSIAIAGICSVRLGEMIATPPMTFVARRKRSRKQPAHRTNFSSCDDVAHQPPTALCSFTKRFLFAKIYVCRHLHQLRKSNSELWT